MHLVSYNLSYIVLYDNNTDDKIIYLVCIYLEACIQARPDLHLWMSLGGTTFFVFHLCIFRVWPTSLACVCWSHILSLATIGFMLYVACSGKLNIEFKKTLNSTSSHGGKRWMFEGAPHFRGASPRHSMFSWIQCLTCHFKPPTAWTRWWLATICGVNSRMQARSAKRKQNWNEKPRMWCCIDSFVHEGLALPEIKIRI